MLRPTVALLTLAAAVGPGPPSAAPPPTGQDLATSSAAPALQVVEIALDNYRGLLEGLRRGDNSLALELEQAARTLCRDHGRCDAESPGGGGVSRLHGGIVGSPKV